MISELAEILRAIASCHTLALIHLKQRLTATPKSPGFVCLQRKLGLLTPILLNDTGLRSFTNGCKHEHATSINAVQDGDPRPTQSRVRQSC